MPFLFYGKGLLHQIMPHTYDFCFWGEGWADSSLRFTAWEAANRNAFSAQRVKNCPKITFHIVCLFLQFLTIGRMFPSTLPLQPYVPSSSPAKPGRP